MGLSFLLVDVTVFACDKGSKPLSPSVFPDVLSLSQCHLVFPKRPSVFPDCQWRTPATGIVDNYKQLTLLMPVGAPHTGNWWFRSSGE